MFESGWRDSGLLSVVCCGSRQFVLGNVFSGRVVFSTVLMVLFFSIRMPFI